MKKILLILLGFFVLPILGLNAANHYWVGGTGTWNDVAHWSATSGGPAGMQIPTINDNVFFDQNSFSAGQQTVMVNTDAFCHSLDWSTIDEDAVFSAASSKSITVTGSYTLSPRLIFGFNGQTLFASSQAGNTITTSGKTITGNWVFNGIGSWAFADDVNTGSQISISLIKGNLNTNGKNMTVGSFIGTGSGNRTLDLGQSIITIENTWDFTDDSNLNFSGRASELIFNNQTIESFKSGNYILYGKITNRGPQAFSVSVVQIEINKCYGDCTAAFVATVTGATGPFIYTWTGSPAVTSSSFTDTIRNKCGSGSAQILTVKNVPNGFITNTSYNITAPSALTIPGFNITEPLCFGGTGVIYPTVIGGTLNYTFLWKPSGLTYDTLATIAGNDTLYVTDLNGCDTSAWTTLTQPTQVVANGGKKNVVCNGAGTGMAWVDPSGGTPWGGANDYTYSWAPGGSTNDTIFNLVPGTYICTVKDANNCSVTYTAVISTASAITALVSQVNVLCSGGSSGSATVTPSGGTPFPGPVYAYSWNTTPPQTTQTATGLIAGTYICTITDAQGCFITKTFTITELNITPVATATPSSQRICSKDTAISILGSNVPGSTFAWTATASSPTITGFLGSGTGNISEILTNTDASGTVTYVITPTGPGPSFCVGLPINFVVTVDPNPTVTNAQMTQSICSGSSTTLVTLTSGVPGTTFAWTATGTAGVSGFTASGTSTIPVQTISTTGITAGTVTYVVTPTGPAPSFCPGTPKNYVITVYPKPTVTNAPMTQAICSGTSTTLVTLTSNVVGATFVWTASGTVGVSGFTANGTSTIPVQTITTTGSTPGTVTYVITPTGPLPLSCAGTPMNYVVTVNPAPIVNTLPLTQSICSGGSTTLVNLTSNVAGTTFIWTATATAGVSGFTASGTNTIPVQTISTTGTTTGTVTFPIIPTGPAPSLCAGVTENYTVTVEPKPTVTNTPLAQSICSGTATTLVTLTSDVVGTTFAWTASGTAGVSGFTASGTGTIPVQTISTTGFTAGTVTYVITPTSPAPCVGTPANYVITVNPAGDVSNAPLTQTICSGTSTTLVTLTSNIVGTAFSWTASATVGISGFALSGTGTIPVQTISTNATTAGTVTYVIIPTGPAPFNCVGTPVNYVITVNPTPALTTSPLNQSVCSGNSTTLVNLTSDVAGTTFSWTASATAGVSGFAVAGTNTIPVQTITTSGSSIGTVTYVITLTGPAPSSCPGATVNFVVSVVPIPTVTNVSMDQAVCSGSNTTLVNLTSLVAGATFNWTATATAGVTGFTTNGTNTIPVQTISTSGTTSGTVTIVVVPTGPAPSSCPGTPGNYIITVNPSPNVSNLPLTQSVCSGGSTALVTLTSAVAGTSFSWTATATADVLGFTAGGTSTIPVQILTNGGATTGTVTYVITPTGPAPSSCVGVPVNYIISVDPKPIVTNAPLTQSICSGSSTSLVNLTSNVVGSSFSWTASATAGVSGFAASGTSTIPVQVISGGTTPGTVTYSITPTGPALLSCPGTPSNFVITVNPKPTVTNTPLVQTICSGGTASFIPISDVVGTTFSWTASASNGSITGFSVSGNGNISDIITNTVAVGTVTYVITPTGPAPSSCPGTSVNFVVTVIPTPAVTNSPMSQSICSGSGTTLVTLTSNVAGTTYSWTASGTAGVSGFTASGTSTIPVQIITSGPSTGTVTYSITPTGPGPSFCPGTPVNYTVTVNPTPTVTNAPLTQSVCSGSGTTLVNLTSNVVGTTFAWTASATAGVSGFAAIGTSTIPAQTISTNQTTAGTITYVITPTGSAPSLCPGTPVNYIITVNPAPAVTNSPLFQSICSGGSTSLVTLTSNVAGTTFAWTAAATAGVSGFTASGTSTIPVQTITGGSVSGTVTYTITPTGPAPSFCVGVPVDYVVSVDPKPTVTNAPLSQSICSGSSTTLVTLTSNVVGTTFAWTASATPGVSGFTASGTSTIPVQTLTFPGPGPGTVTYVITPTGPALLFCPGTPVNYVVTITSSVDVTNIPLAQSVCSGDNSTLVTLTSNVGGSTFAWTASATAGVSGFPPSGTSTIPVQTLSTTAFTPGTITYVVTPTGPAPSFCAGPSVNYVITVYPKPAVTNALLTQTICSGDTALLIPTSDVTGTTFSWTASASNGSITGFSASGTGNISDVITNTGASGTVTYIITPTGPAPSSCPGTPVSFVVTVNPAVTASPTSQTICSGDITSIALTSNVPSATFAWTVVQTNVSGASSGSGTPIAQVLTNTSPVLQIDGTAVYTITPTANGCIGTPIDVTVTVKPKPIATATPALETICSGDTTSIVLSSNVLLTTFNWVATPSTVTGASDSNGNTIAQILTGLPSGLVVYTITPVANGCTGAPTNVTVTVNPVPVATASPSIQSICSGSSVSISLSSIPAATSFDWTVAPTGVTGALPGSGASINQTLSSAIVDTVFYMITPSIGACAGTPIFDTVGVNPVPVATATPTSDTICSGTATSIVLNSPLIGTTYSWTVSETDESGASAGSGNSIVQTLTSTSLILPGIAIYTITPSFTSCTGTAIFDTVNVLLKIAAVVDTSLTPCGVCAGAITLTPNSGTAPYAFNWVPSAPGTIVSTNFVSDGTSLCAGLYTITVTDANNCSSDIPVALSNTGGGATGEIVTTTDVLCFSDSTGTGSVIPVGGTAPFSYLWNDVPSTPDSAAINLPAGNYWVQVTETVSGCVHLSPVTINQPATAVTGAITVQTNIPCFGDGNVGSITVGGSDGTPGYTYTLNATTNATGVFNNLPAGVDTVIVSDTNGCTVSVPFTITIPAAALTASIISQTNVTCYGGNNGSITASASGGTGTFVYSIDGTNFQLSTTFSNLPACIDTVITVKDLNNCTDTVHVTITQPSVTVVGAITSQTDVLCKGDTTGIVTVTASNGVPNYLFDIGFGWLPAPGIFTDLIAGNYTVAILDAAGCTASVPVTITEPATALSASIFLQTNILCNGDTTGCITIISAGGTGVHSFSIDGGLNYQLDSTFCNLWAGSYTLNVKDANGCTDTVQVTITEPTIPLTAVILSQTNILCKGDTTGCVTIAASGGTPVYAYSLDGTIFQADSTFCNLLPGSYIITIRDANGCIDTVSVNITEPALGLTATILSQVNVLCKGDTTGCATIVANGGTLPYTYSLDGLVFQPDSTFCSLVAGSYIITVQDANGCIDTVHVDITEPATALAATILSQTNILCYGDTTGCVTIVASGGTPGYTYSLDGLIFQPDSTFCNLLAGSYIITARDANGCTDTVQVTISEPASPLVASLLSQTNILCKGDTTGCITVVASGGTPVYAYSLNGGVFQADSSFCNLLPGFYIITVLDANGCMDTIQVTITEPTNVLAATILSQVNVLCKGDTTGCVTIMASGGTPAYSYSLDGGSFQPGSTFCNLVAGSYIITVQDANGCIDTVQVTITEPDSALAATLISQTNVNCFGGNDGSVTVAATIGTGTPIYTYVLASSLGTSLTGVFVGLSVGTDTVVTVDANGCTVIIPFTITGPAQALAATITSQTNVKCNGGNDGSVTVVATPGTGTAGYSYIWSCNGDINLTGTFAGLSAGSCTVIVTDTNGCTKNVPVTISQAPAIAANETVFDATCGNTDGSIFLAASGGTGAPSNFTYLWTSPPAPAFPLNTYDSLFNINSGIYPVTITDSVLCSSTTNIQVVNSNGPNSATVTQQNVSCYGVNDGEITSITNIVGGTLPYTISPALPMQNLAPGTYVVTITDSIGCTLAIPVVITGPAEILPNVNIVQPSCGVADGSVTVTPTGCSNFTYLWSGGTIAGSTDSLQNNLLAGIYSVHITCVSTGCSIDAPVVLQNFSTLVLTTTGTNLSCNGITPCDGTATVTVAGGAVQSMLWSDLNAQITPTATSLCAGTYYISVTGTNLCVSIDSVVITQPQPILANETVIDATCGNSDGSIFLAASGGTGSSSNFSYLWTSPPAPAFPLNSYDSLVNINSGIYPVSITDSIGCSSTTSIQVINSNGPASATVTQQNVSCYGVNDGEITSVTNIVGGTPPYTISPVLPMQNLAPGTYIVTVTDFIGCSLSIPVVITSPSQILANPTIVQPTCSASDGSITLNPSGCSVTCDVLWSTGPITPAISNLPAGVYSVLITCPTTGCSQAFSYPLSNPTTLVLTTSATDVTCNSFGDGTATVTATGGTVQDILWSDPIAQTAQTAVGLTPDVYYVWVTETNSCISIDSVIINQPQPILANETVIDATCGNLDGSIFLAVSGGTGSASNFSYLWTSPPAPAFPLNTYDSLVDINSGIYPVTITDSIGCSSTASIQVINSNGPASATVTQQNVSCYGVNDGEITSVTNIVGGTPPYTISPVLPMQNLIAGTYIVTITDFTGCSLAMPVVITSPAQILANSSIVQPTCSASDGSITLNPSGCSVTCDVLWSTGPITPAISNLPAGIYSVLITCPTTGCSQVFSFPLSNSTPLVLTTSSTNVTCNSYGDGEATVTATGGTVQDILWSDPSAQITPTAVGLGPDVYFVWVTETNSCISIDSVLITEPQLLAFDPATISPILCNGDSNGVIVVNPTGGTLPYTFTWFPSVSTIDSATNLGPDTYTVTLTDTNNCIAAPQTNVLVDPPALTISHVSADPSCNTIPDGSIDITVGGGTPGAVIPYSYLWTGPYTATNEDTIGVYGGNYTVVATDANGCTISDNIALVPVVIVIANAGNDTLFCEAGSFTLNAGASINTSTYQWYQIPSGFNPGNTVTVSINPPSGPSTWYVLVGNGGVCSDKDTITISSIPLPTASAGFDTSLCLAATITLNAGGSTNANSYLWYQIPLVSSIGNTVTIPVMPVTGDTTGYYVEINNGAGCLDTDTVNVIIYNPINANAGKDSTFCQVGDTPYLLNAGGSVNAINYEWFETTPSTFLDDSIAYFANPTSLGTSYYVVVNNGFGCLDTDTVVIASRPVPVADAGTAITILYDHSTTIGGNPTGPPGASYIWSPSIGLDNSYYSNPVAEPSGTTVYSVVVTSAEGCQSTDTVIVTVLPKIKPPGGITPNDDGVNDVWVIDNIEKFPDCLVEVYNRWGELLFQSKGYLDKWNGTFKGLLLPVGTYYYVIDLNDELYPKALTGPITIMR